MIKKSLEENQEHILNELPGKFHEAFKAELAAAPSEEEQKVAMEAELENIKKTIEAEG